MGHTDPEIRLNAADALAGVGRAAVPLLIDALGSPRGLVRLGAIEVLARIRDPRAISPIKVLISHDRNIEIRWAAVLALGEMGSQDPVPDLLLLLNDENKYIRYGAALSLQKLDWIPAGENEEIAFRIALQDWESVKKSGASSIPLLTGIFRETDAAIRSAIIGLLGARGDPRAYGICQTGLKDRNSKVRWSAVLAAMNCGISAIHLPPLVADRERTGPNPAAAALLNFLFLGIGYNYIGKWWGFPVFMAYMFVLVLAQLYFGPFLPYLVAYPITAVLGIHIYYIT